MSLSQERVERLALIESLLPTDLGANPRALTAKEIQERLESTDNDTVRDKRSIQRDLKHLLEEGRICKVKNQLGLPGYLRIEESDEIDESVWEYFVGHLKKNLEGIVSSADLTKLLNRFNLGEQGVRLDERKLCILPDSLRLQPAKIKYKIFGTILRALKENRSVDVSYTDRQGKSSTRVLHPQGIMQRGPRIYLFALRDEEAEERLYAIDRIRDASLRSCAARKKADFDFKRHISEGRADFANGEYITLKAIVRGYVEDLVYDCPLHESQILKPLIDSEQGSLLTVTMPSSGQLLRWVLACGCNIVVIEPSLLREIVVSQLNQSIKSYDSLNAGDGLCL